MEPGEKAGLATPVDQQRRRRKSIFVFGFFLVAVLGGLTATVLSVNNCRNYKRVLREFGIEHYLLPPPPLPKLRVDRQRQVAPHGLYPPRLLAQNPGRVAPFQRPLPTSPNDGCNNLGAGGRGEAKFAISDSDWECLYFAEFGAAPERASLFVQVRGKVPESLRSFRIKLSLTDPTQDEAVIRAAMETTDRFGLPLTAESRNYLRERLTARLEFTSMLETFRMTFSREMTDDRRFNLLILPRPQTISCGTLSSASLHNTYASISMLPVGCLPLVATPD